MAGGPIMTGWTYISGTDRSDGKVYNDPRQLFSNNTAPRILPAYPGDTVSFYARVFNWDPFPIGGDVNIKIYKYNSFTSSGVTPTNDKLIDNKDTYQVGAPPPLWPVSFWWYKGSNIFQLTSPWKEKVAGPGSSTPGNRFCYYVQTNPTVYDVTNILVFRDPVVEGLHKFNVNPDKYHLKPGLFFDTAFLGLLDNANIGNPMSCVEVAYNYNLVPSISLGTGGSTGAGGSTNVSTAVSQGTLSKNSTPTYTKKTQWQVSQFFLPEGTSAPGITTTSVANLCKDFFESSKIGGKSCKIPKLSDGKTDAKSSGTNTVFDADGSFKSGTSLPMALQSPGTIPDGYVVCYALSVKSYKPYLTTPAWRNSAVVCSELASKKPKVQILGDDIRVGGKISTSQTTATVGSLERLFGSWGEYASYSVGTSTGFATQSGFDGGASTGALPSEWGKLTFANTQSTYGQFSSNVASRGATAAKDFFTQAGKPSNKSGTITLSSLSGSKTPYIIDNGGTTLTIKGGSNIAKGKTVIIVATGTVKITSDITYTPAELSSLKDIPQVVIVAKNILIDPDVQRIDAWLIADYQSGTINTCDISPPKVLTMKICDKPLQVNGPLVTDKLLLNRTAGSEDSDPGAPAETFNNNGISYLWAENYSHNTGSLITTYQREAPPRF